MRRERNEIRVIILTKEDVRALLSGEIMWFCLTIGT